jgi:hypothetical protein
MSSFPTLLQEIKTTAAEVIKLFFHYKLVELSQKVFKIIMF